MSKDDIEAIQKALDELGLFMVGVVDCWTYEQRLLYENATKILNKYRTALDG